MADRRLAGPQSELGAWECILYETAQYVDTGATASLRERSGVSSCQTQPNAAQKSQITATAADQRKNSELHRNIQYANFVNQIQMIYIENSNETFIWIFFLVFLSVCRHRGESKVSIQFNWHLERESMAREFVENSKNFAKRNVVKFMGNSLRSACCHGVFGIGQRISWHA